MREAYTGVRMARTRIEGALGIEKEWLGNVPLSLKIFSDQMLDPFLPILSRGA